MNEMPSKLKARAERKSAKRDQKKRLIAESAIEALKELGYANTSLRDIAAKSDLSLGMLHYYFEDRSDLIIYCVRTYKFQFVQDLTEALQHAEGRDAVIEVFSEALVTSIFDDEMTHRLWYDIRGQAMFDTAFRPVVEEIENLLIDMVGEVFRRAGHELTERPVIAYALIDGAFRHLMQSQFGSNRRSREELVETFRSILDRFL